MITKNLKIISIAVLAGLVCLAPAVFGAVSSSDPEIESLNQSIKDRQSQIDSLKSRQDQYRAEIEAREKDKDTLNNQLAIIGARLSQAQLDIDSANLEIDKTNLEIQKVEIDSTIIDKQIENKQDEIADLLRLLYKQNQASTLEMLLANDSLSGFLNQTRYLEDVNKKVGDSVSDLQADKDEMEANKSTLAQKTAELEKQKQELQDKKDSLAFEEDRKTDLLSETNSSEAAYQSLLAQARREQLQAESEVASAEALIRQKMSAGDKQKLDDGETSFIWPVPKNVIVTKFHDPDYPFRTVIGEHPAVDIRAAQGTPIKAVADGYVGKVKFDGTTSYAYIMLIHGNGLSTVYGHVSAVYVKTDQYVTQGEIIGRTGATPGTVGAGPFTTGPHLHFEVRMNGLPVDPENYLP